MRPGKRGTGPGAERTKMAEVGVNRGGSLGSTWSQERGKQPENR